MRRRYLRIYSEYLIIKRRFLGYYEYNEFNFLCVLHFTIYLFLNRTTHTHTLGEISKLYKTNSQHKEEKKVIDIKYQKVWNTRIFFFYIIIKTNLTKY